MRVQIPPLEPELFVCLKNTLVPTGVIRNTIKAAGGYNQSDPQHLLKSGGLLKSIMLQISDTTSLVSILFLTKTFIYQNAISHYGLVSAVHPLRVNKTGRQQPHTTISSKNIKYFLIFRFYPLTPSHRFNIIASK